MMRIDVTRMPARRLSAWACSPDSSRPPGARRPGVGRQEGRPRAEGVHAKVDGDLQVEDADEEGKSTGGEAGKLSPSSPSDRPSRGWRDRGGGLMMAAPALDRPHPRRSVDRSDANSQSLPYQAAAVGLLWIGIEDVHQWGIPLRRWPTETLQEGLGHSRTEHQPQPRPEKYLQGCSHASGCYRWSFSGLLPGLRGPRNETALGASHLGA